MDAAVLTTTPDNSAGLKVEEPELFELKNVQIFEAGTWNGDKYTDEDLDAIVESFDAIGGKIKPYVKLGHDQGQKLLQKDGFPAAAWITGIRRKGQKLFADFSNMPKKIYELVTRKAYGRISSEIFWNLKEGGKNYRRVLKGVALLGADTPALTSLDDFINLYTEDFNFEDLKLCTNRMDVMENNDYIKKIEELEKENKELKTYMDQLAYDKRHSEIENYLEKAIEGGKITPAQKDYFLSLGMDACVKSYTRDNKSYSGDGFYFVKGIIDNMAMVQLGEQAHVEGKENKTYSKSNSDDLDVKIREYADKNKCNYADAYVAVVNGEVK